MRLVAGREVSILQSEAKRRRRFSHRNRLETVACILKNSNGASRKTRLIYTCNLSSGQFDLYKDFLVEASLLVSTSEESGEIFETTEKGRKFLADYQRIRRLLE